VAVVLEEVIQVAQVVVLKDGREMYNKAFGTHVWNEAGSKALPVKKTDVYDIASLTKTTATLLAVMKLYDGGRLNLTDRVSDYLPFLQDTDKKNITVRELLMHESGLPSIFLFLCVSVLNAAEPFVTFISADAKLPLVTPQNRSFSIWCDDAEHRGVLLAV
jgi:CubicO group peptidase (beta-lactamase class C family)